MLESAARTLSAAFGGGFRRRAAHSDDVRQLVTELRAVLKDLIASGGFSVSDYPDGAKRPEEQLEDLFQGLRDRKLKHDCGAVLAAYRRTWASAPPALDGRRSLHVNAQLLCQGEAAHEALGAIQRVLERLSQLERWVSPARETRRKGSAHAP